MSSVMLVYGFPMALLGAALAYAQVGNRWEMMLYQVAVRVGLGLIRSPMQLDPCPCKTTKAAFELRASQCTDIQKQIREDCTRFRWAAGIILFTKK